MRYLFHYLPTGTLPTYDLGDWLDRNRKEKTETETDRDRQRQTETERQNQTETEIEKPIPNYQSKVEEIHSRAKRHDKNVYCTLPPTIFTQFFFFSSRFRIFFLVPIVRKKTRDDPKYMYLVRRVKSRVEHKKCHISEMREKKKKKSDIGR